MFDEVAEGLLRPVEILEPEHERLRLGEVCGPLLRGPGDLLTAPAAGDGVQHARCEAEEVGHGVARAGLAELVERLLGRVVRRDPGRRLHHLRQRAIRQPLAERERSPRQDRGALEPCEEFAREAALADARVAEDRDELGAVITHRAGERVGQELELLLPSDVRRNDVERPAPRALRADHAPDVDARRKAFELPLAERLGDDARREPRSRRPDQDLAGIGGLLQARGDVDRLPGGERRVAVLDHDLTGLDPDPDGKLAVARLDDRHRGADRALRVVLVGDGYTEDREHGVPGELLDLPAVRVDVLLDPFEEACHPPACDLRVVGGDERRRVHQVDEQRRRELSLHG